MIGQRTSTAFMTKPSTSEIWVAVVTRIHETRLDMMLSDILRSWLVRCMLFAPTLSLIIVYVIPNTPLFATAGCLPYFENLEKVPPHIIPFMPRELLIAAKQFADREAVSIDPLGRPVEFQSSEKFNHTAYNELTCCVLAHARKHQTSLSLAKHILGIVNISSGVRSVLLLGEYPNYDYMAVSILHGLRELLGVDSVSDFPENPVYYHVPPEKAAFETLKSQYIHG